MFVLFPFLILIIAMLAFMPLMLRFAVCLHRSSPWRSYLRPGLGILVAWSAMMVSYVSADHSGIDPVTVYAAPVAIGMVPFSLVSLVLVIWLQHLTSRSS